MLRQLVDDRFRTMSQRCQPFSRDQQKSPLRHQQRDQHHGPRSRKHFGPLHLPGRRSYACSLELEGFCRNQWFCIEIDLVNTREMRGWLWTRWNYVITSRLDVALWISALALQHAHPLRLYSYESNIPRRAGDRRFTRLGLPCIINQVLGPLSSYQIPTWLKISEGTHLNTV